jgi:ribosomal protein L37AE/L43A
VLYSNIRVIQVQDTPREIHRKSGIAWHHHVEPRTGLRQKTAVRRSEAVSQMTRYCPGCGGDQVFERPHAGQGDCPEWACTACGTALILGFVPRAVILDSLPGERDRAA